MANGQINTVETEQNSDDSHWMWPGIVDLLGTKGGSCQCRAGVASSLATAQSRKSASFSCV